MSATEALAFLGRRLRGPVGSRDSRPNARLTETVSGPREVTAGIDLDPETWTVERADPPRRIVAGPDGRTAEATDHVVLIHRTA
ncbi:hypothetical protein [Streptomyces sp. NPDC088801]|uniref:hypothetical protein n=1 Tax=Streptomyces sp. NPDC088801 TaxID=3365903 RepID=UPI003810A801